MCLFLQYRDIVRQFIKGTDGFAGGFAECLCGSPHLYQVHSEIPLDGSGTMQIGWGLWKCHTMNW
jgi:hypothetical protein